MQKKKTLCIYAEFIWSGRFLAKEENPKKLGWRNRAEGHIVSHYYYPSSVQMVQEKNCGML
jgi:acetylglutamate synthase